MIGVVIVLISFVLGLYGKVIIVAKLYHPVELITGISVYAFSFVLLFLGVFLVGWRTVRIIQSRIHHHVKKTVKITYKHTKRLHKKGINKITKTSKIIAKKFKQND